MFILLQDQKKLEGQLLAEQEALYGSKPTPMKNTNGNKADRLSYGGANKRKLSLGATPMLQTPRPGMRPTVRATPNTQSTKKNECINQVRRKDGRFSAPPSSGNSFLMVLYSEYLMEILARLLLMHGKGKKKKKERRNLARF